MDWSKVADFAVQKGLPLLGGVLGGPAGAAIGTGVASLFGTEPEPDQVLSALQADPDAVLKLKQYQMDHEARLQGLLLEAETARMREVNETYRREIASSDRYVSRMRPTFGYIVALTILIEALIAVYVAGWAPGHLPDLATLYNALAIPQSIALAVLGVYVKKRSDEKIGAGTGPGLLQGLLGARS